MADIVTMDLTAAGLNLYSKINAGLTDLKVSRVVIGDGYLAPGETTADLTALKHQIDNVDVQIIDSEVIGDGRSRMLIRITGQNEDFYLREIGIMSPDPDEGEILYSACNYGDMADYVMTYAGAAPVMQEGNIYFITGTGELTIEVSHDNASVTHKEFEEHTDDETNPHNVTAAQIFPSNSGVLAAITQALVTAWNSAASAAHSHGNKSILDTITQALIDKWNSAVTHITNKSNPHSVSKEQVGLGNVPNVGTNDQKPTFTEAEKRENIASGETLSMIFGKIMKWFSSLKSIAFSGSYKDLEDKPTLFSGNYSDLLNIPSSFTPSTHYHNWGNIQNKPSTFPPSAHTHSKVDVGLGNVTNESKETMFSSPQFTGTPRATTANTGDSSTRVATTGFVQNELSPIKDELKKVTFSNKLEVTYANGKTSFYHYQLSGWNGQFLENVVTTFGNAEFGEGHGNFSPALGAQITLYIRVYIENGVIKWDEYYNDIYDVEDYIEIGTGTLTEGGGGSSTVSFTYINDDAGQPTEYSLREAIIELANEIRMFHTITG